MQRDFCGLCINTELCIYQVIFKCLCYFDLSSVANNMEQDGESVIWVYLHFQENQNIFPTLAEFLRT